LKNSISTFHYNSVDVHMYKIIIQQQQPDCLHELMLAVSEDGSCGRETEYFMIKILNVIGKLATRVSVQKFY